MYNVGTRYLYSVNERFFLVFRVRPIRECDKRKGLKKANIHIPGYAVYARRRLQDFNLVDLEYSDMTENQYNAAVLYTLYILPIL